MRSSSKLIVLIATLVAPATLPAQSYPSAADPRSNLKPGRFDAGVAASNMRLVSFSPKPAVFDTVRGLHHVARRPDDRRQPAVRLRRGRG